MNLQTIAVIFAIIVIPISLVLSAYIGTHIDTLVYQSQYDSKLAKATYDAVKAFQLNTLNNQYSTISDSKIRDIEASVNVFFDSLGTNLGWGSYNENQVKEHVPALVYTLYDGYYIYSKYDNIGNPTLDNNSELTRNNQYGLKPYIYYTCRYKNDSGSFDFIINYTLDNAIVIYGMIDGEYKTVSGYMENYDENEFDGDEILKEKVLILDNNDVSTGTQEKEYYYNEDGTKIYSEGANRYLYKESKLIGTGTINLDKEDGAQEYAKSYEKNLQEVVEKICAQVRATGIGRVYACDNNGAELENVALTANVFDVNQNPEDSASDFNEHKRAVIQRSIKSNLYTAMANFSRNSLSSYEFRMPEIDETEWDKVVSNVGLIAFMQGIPMGNKYYNDYCIVSNNNNKEFVSEDSIYIIATDSSGREEYHRVGCRKLDESGVILGQAYLNIDFRRQTVKGKEIDKNDDGSLRTNPITEEYIYIDKNYYYYPQEARGLLQLHSESK